ncbi:MAG: nitrilase family protein [Bacteroidetes bacterium]|nr:nitrilase family protein [Bacteroidota bacterium]MDA1119376.1 nitrilase family protein [Bacteroidota bacterium]
MSNISDLKVTLVQSPLHWEDIGANLAMFEEKIWQIGQPTDLIVLPEMFSTGFSMNATKLAEQMGLRTFKWMKQMSAQSEATLFGSFIASERGKYFNRAIAMNPDGSYDQYDKRHPFSLGREHELYAAGKKKVIFELKGWKICPLICYDLRFPVWSRNRFIEGHLEYDILVCIASWPKPRISAWDTLLKARAIENLSYAIGVNRIGVDGNELNHVGHSAIYDYLGDTVCDLEDQEIMQTSSLNYTELKEFREKLPFHLDADHFEIKT